MSSEANANHNSSASNGESRSTARSAIDDEMRDSQATALFAMCPPQYFEVSYLINPWMRPGEWQANPQALLKKAQDGWQRMYETFQSLGVCIYLVTPQIGLPDMVFTANSAVVLNRRVLLSRFRHKERLGEEVHFAGFFEQLQQKGIVDQVDRFPAGINQEGAGDCYWDSHRQLFWAGYGPRSSKAAAQYVEDYFGKPVVALALATEEFYHMDVSFCPLSKGEVIYYPAAFTKESLSIIYDHVPPDKLIAVDREDAAQFAVNAVNIEDKVIMARLSKQLSAQLKERGYTPISVPVETFALSGGSVFCMTLRLDQKSMH